MNIRRFFSIANFGVEENREIRSGRVVAVHALVQRLQQTDFMVNLSFSKSDCEVNYFRRQPESGSLINPSAFLVWSPKLVTTSGAAAEFLKDRKLV